MTNGELATQLCFAKKNGPAIVFAGGKYLTISAVCDYEPPMEGERAEDDMGRPIEDGAAILSVV